MFRFLINPHGNNKWTEIHFYYLNELCTCSDLDQNTILIKAFSSEAITYFTPNIGQQVFGIVILGLI